MSSQYQYGGNTDETYQKLVPGPGATGNLDFHDFLSQVSNIQTSISTLSQNVTTIASQHNQALSSYDTGSPEAAQQTAQLEALVAETGALNRYIRDEIKFLERDSKFPGDPQGNAKAVQVDKLKRGFDAELKNYQLMESQYRGQYRTQMERQYRIVKPDATEEEVQQAVDSGETSVFSQAILSSGRSANAQSVASAVRSRHAEIQRIERTLLELVQLFEDMAREVEAAEPVVQVIENAGYETKQDLEKAQVHLEVATKHAWNTKRNKWICLGIVVVILLIIAIALAVRFAPRGGNNNNNNNNNNNSRPAKRWSWAQELNWIEDN